MHVVTFMYVYSTQLFNFPVHVSIANHVLILCSLTFFVDLCLLICLSLFCLSSLPSLLPFFSPISSAFLLSHVHCRSITFALSLLFSRCTSHISSLILELVQVNNCIVTSTLLLLHVIIVLCWVKEA